MAKVKFDWTYVVRFLRTIIPQLPAVIVYLNGWKPEWAAELALAGAVVTAIDKYLRDHGFYEEIGERIGL